ncbi:Protein tyrosine/serine phosphatase [Raineyella antarctica]|uniref:Protein tyrosine/serine phosphatase n=1 Tax=Raineyella antarctica TaxID=1577474 RepID=A0A1G6HDZ2_9ACTN|nr:Protein tyrosine/serine phosphatase [Raineyella antarctica]
MQWLEFDSLVNARDVGGIPTTDGRQVRSRRLIRSDNLQALTEADVARLRGLGVTDVVDLRSVYEVESEGPGPLTTADGFTIHHHSFFIERYADGSEIAPGGEEGGLHTGESELPGDALPWAGKRAHTIQVEDGFASSYLSFLADRPASVLGALRNVAYAPGATLVHCAAGKDRTGTTVALALMVAGAEREAVVADYAASTERMELIVARLVERDTYAANLADRPLSSHDTRPESMLAFLEYAEDRFGGVEPMLGQIGWTAADSAQLRRKLLD